MAKDITIRVNGQNPDGTLNVSQVGGDAGNPFGTPGTNTGIVPYQPSQSAVGGFRARIGNSEVMFATEADFLKADREMRALNQTNYNTIPTVGGGGFTGSAGGGGWLRTAGGAARTVADFLAARNLRGKIRDLDEALIEGNNARRDLDALEQSGKYNDLIPILRRALLAERDATDSSITALEDQVTALDINAGAGIAETVSEFVGSGSGTPAVGSGSGGGAPRWQWGGVGLGLGLLLSQDRDRRRRRR